MSGRVDALRGSDAGETSATVLLQKTGLPGLLNAGSLVENEIQANPKPHSKDGIDWTTFSGSK